MRKSSFVALILGMAVAVTACSAPTGGQSATGLPPGISVTGLGEVTGTPDTLTMMFGVSVLRPTVSQAVTVAADKANAVIAALKAQGVAEDDIQTANYSIYPEYNYSQTGQELIGYRIDNTVTAKIRNLDSSGAVIDAVAAAGGDDVRVSGVTFAIEDDAELLQAGRTAAWADARAKAEQLAELAGVTLGEPVAISEVISQPPIIFPFARDAAAEGGDTPIEPGQQTVTVTLSVEFAIGG